MFIVKLYRYTKRERIQKVLDRASSGSDSETDDVDDSSSSNDEGPSVMNQLMSVLGVEKGSCDSNSELGNKMLSMKTLN